jgi:hypothetical protein
MKKGGKVVRKEKGPKDDGSRWQVVRDLVPVYRGEGLTKSEAERLANSLAVPATIQCIKETESV